MVKLGIAMGSFHAPVGHRGSSPFLRTPESETDRDVSLVTRVRDGS